MMSSEMLEPPRSPELVSRIMQLAETLPMSEWNRNHVRNEFGRGLDYHDEFVRRLGFAGKRALDAGCGVGNLTLSLARHFSEVVALEYDQERLTFAKEVARAAGATGILPMKGTIESLPFPDGTFDGVFCHGVVFLTEWKKSLDELVRVLAPGGRIYISYDTLNWWDHLIFERSRTTPSIVPHATRVLLNQAIELLREIDPSAVAGRRGRWLLMRRLIDSVVGHGPPKRSIALPRSMGDRMSAALCRFRLKCEFLFANIVFAVRNEEADSGALLYSLWPRSGNVETRIGAIGAAISRTINYGTSEQRKMAMRALEHVRRGQPVPPSPHRGYCLEPWQVVEALAERHLSVVGDAPDSWLNFTGADLNLKSIYPVNLGVREAVAVRQPVDGKIGALTPVIDVDFLRGRGRWAAANAVAFTIGAHVENRDSGDSYDEFVAALYTKLAKQFDCPGVLRAIVTELQRSASTESERFLAVYRFIQGCLFHHPTVQLRWVDGRDAAVRSVAVLLAGMGRCAHVAEVAAEMFAAGGWSSRVKQLHRHLCAEVLVDGRWLIVDADAFKAGQWPRTADGRWATLADAQADPGMLDRVPAIGHQLSRQASWARDHLGRVLSGYVDTGLAWERPLLSHIYFGGDMKAPARPPRVTAERLPGRVRITLDEIDPGTAQVELWIGRVSRGWTYADYPDERYLMRPDGSVLHRTVDRAGASGVIEIEVEEGPAFINVAAADDYQMRVGAWTWPAEEVRIP